MSADVVTYQVVPGTLKREVWYADEILGVVEIKAGQYRSSHGTTKLAITDDPHKAIRSVLGAAGIEGVTRAVWQPENKEGWLSRDPGAGLNRLVPIGELGLLQLEPSSSTPEPETHQELREPAAEAITGIRLISLEQIIADDSVQSRAQLDMLAVSEYAQALEDGIQGLPPVTVFADGSSYWLSDGYHRHAAHKAAGRTEINCDVRLGNKRAALLHSAGSNQQHGLRRSNADKRRAVEMVLRDSEWASWTDRAIGLHCGVDGKTVATVRTDLEFAGEIKPQDVRTTTAGKPVTAKKLKALNGPALMNLDREPRASTEHGSTQGDTRPTIKTVHCKATGKETYQRIVWAEWNGSDRGWTEIATLRVDEHGLIADLTMPKGPKTKGVRITAKSWIGAITETIGECGGIVSPDLEVKFFQSGRDRVEVGVPGLPPFKPVTSSSEPEVRPQWPDLVEPQVESVERLKTLPGRPGRTLDLIRAAHAAVKIVIDHGVDDLQTFYQEPTGKLEFDEFETSMVELIEMYDEIKRLEVVAT